MGTSRKVAWNHRDRGRYDGLESTKSQHKDYHIRRANIKGIRGYFDGGRSSQGVGIGWVVDILVLPHSSTPASWIFDIASEAAHPSDLHGLSG